MNIAMLIFMIITSICVLALYYLNNKLMNKCMHDRILIKIICVKHCEIFLNCVDCDSAWGARDIKCQECNSKPILTIIKGNK